MALQERELDANFYLLVHQLVGSQIRQNQGEKRAGKRSTYAATQRIAVWDGEEIPDDSQFIAIRCNDLTQNGFSFLMPQKPEFDQIVAAFGAPAHAIYVAAKVTRVWEVDSSNTSEENGLLGGQGFPAISSASIDEPMFLVGCQFTERLAKSSSESEKSREEPSPSLG
jgi:hypothetical protein